MKKKLPQLTMAAIEKQTADIDAAGGRDAYVQGVVKKIKETDKVLSQSLGAVAEMGLLAAIIGSDTLAAEAAHTLNGMALLYGLLEDSL